MHVENRRKCYCWKKTVTMFNWITLIRQPYFISDTHSETAGCLQVTGHVTVTLRAMFAPVSKAFCNLLTDTTPFLTGFTNTRWFTNKVPDVCSCQYLLKVSVGLNLIMFSARTIVLNDPLLQKTLPTKWKWCKDVKREID